MYLNELTGKIKVLQINGSDCIEIKDICYDSRLVQPGSLFVAVKGFKTDGHRFVEEAVKAGAPAVLVQEQVILPGGVTRVLVEDSRIALAQVSSAFFGNPSHEIRLVGVTGTNGKTTITNLIATIHRCAGQKVGLISTIANYIGDRKLEVSHTTPESADLQSLLREMVDEGVTVAVMEVSSHALSLERVAGCEYDVAVFTNLTQDHLDFHRDMEDYLDAKVKLFKSVGGGVKKGPKYVVVNIDDPYAERIIAGVEVPVITYGIIGKADVKALDIKVIGSGCSFKVKCGYGTFNLKMKITGLFNVYNTLAAFAAGVAGGYDPELVARSLESVGGVPGRFELVDCGQNFTVVVDYAHTPDGLENVLKAARAITSGRILTVFGCGGDRDRTKRPLMGEIAGLHSDVPIITSDNPRTEDPLAIISDVEAGIVRVKKPGEYLVMPDRRQAIRAALGQAQRDDLVVIAGKGHEDYQIIGEKKYHFDDREEARSVLKDISAAKDD